MGICRFNITLDFTKDNGELESHHIEVEAEVPESGPLLIDNIEQVIMEMNKDAIRQAVSKYLEELSKKKPEMKADIDKALSRLTLPITEWMEK